MDAPQRIKFYFTRFAITASVGIGGLIIWHHFNWELTGCSFQLAEIPGHFAIEERSHYSPLDEYDRRIRWTDENGRTKTGELTSNMSGGFDINFYRVRSNSRIIELEYGDANIMFDRDRVRLPTLEIQRSVSQDPNGRSYLGRYERVPRFNRSPPYSSKCYFYPPAEAPEILFVPYWEKERASNSLENMLTR